jgi:hypothetical protein
MANWLKFFVLLACSSIILSGGCGDITGELASITVNPSSATVGVNQPRGFTAIGKDGAGFIVQVNPTWSVEGSIGSISSTGQFIAGSTEGSGYVVATSGSLSGKASVTVTAKGWLEGILSGSYGAIEGIQVALQGYETTLSANADSHGNYSIAGIPAGTYVAYTRENDLYQSSSKEVTISSGETSSWSPTLVPQAWITTTTSITLPF